MTPSNRVELKKKMISGARAPAFILAIGCMGFFAYLPSYLSLILLFRRGIGQLPLIHWVLHLAFSALILGFQLAVLAQLVQLGRDYSRKFWKYYVPPYNPWRPDHPHLPLPDEWKLQRRKRKLRVGFFFLITGFVVATGASYGFTEYLQWNIELIEPFIKDQTWMFILNFLSTIANVPIRYLGEGFASPENTSSFVGSFLILWLPAPFVTVGFLNLSSYLYEILQASLRRLLQNMMFGSGRHYREFRLDALQISTATYCTAVFFVLFIIF